MAAFPQMPLSDDRFGEYVVELNEFSDSHRIPCGKPEDLKLLLAALLEFPDFASEFGSMIRSIVLREHFQVSNSELMTVIAVAWGGIPTETPSNELPDVIEELQVVVEELLRKGTLGKPDPVPAPKADSEERITIAPDVDDTIRELEDVSPDVQMYRQLLKFQDDNQTRSHPHLQPPSGKRPGTFRSVEEPEVVQETRLKPFRDSGFMRGSIGVETTAHPRRLEPNAIEILATALTGLVVALLFTVGSLPVYRTHVSVDLPATASAGLSTDLTAQVSRSLLERPHPTPILRQDALSRGMRDLKLGGSETILYADLVVDTAHRVKVRKLESPGVYEITCDSWNAQFATTFCNQVLATLFNSIQGKGSSLGAAEIPHSIDAAVGPGIQIYPHWYLQGIAGLALGCLVGLAVGFIKRPQPEADSSE